MKNDVMPSIVQMERKVLEKLCTEVKETLATGIPLSRKNSNSFGVVDLWSIQRNMKSANRPFKRRRNRITNYIYP